MKYLVSLGYLVMLIVNFLANSLPINGLNTGQVSANYDNLFTPAGFAFSIWGVIYILLLFVVIELFKAKRIVLTKEIGPAFIASSLLNSVWIFAWHYQQVALSVIIMLGLLAILIFINQKIRNLDSRLARIAFGIYLGWICVATIANITVLLVSISWSGWGIAPQFWAVIMVFAGSAIAIVAMNKLRNPFIIIPVAWAFIAIFSRRIDDYQVIAYGALLAILVVVGFLAIFLRKQKCLFPEA